MENALFLIYIIGASMSMKHILNYIHDDSSEVNIGNALKELKDS